jgi:hypothetical protein
VTRIIQGSSLSSGAHQFTAYALETLRRVGIQSVGSQIVVYAGRCATAVDILGRDRDGGFCVVELKCSSVSKYSSACGPMHGALACRGDSLAEQHAVQVGVTRLMFERTYNLRASAYVLQVNSSGTTLTFVPRALEFEAALAAISE